LTHTNQELSELLDAAAAGEITIEQLRERSGLSAEDLLIALGEEPPEPTSSQDTTAQDNETATDTQPETITDVSLEALGEIAKALRDRVKTEGQHMTSGELAQAGSLLDKLSAQSVQVAAAAKIDQPTRREAASTMLRDTRPWADGRTGFRLWTLQANHPAMLNSLTFDPNETEESRKANVRVWFDNWFPLNCNGDPVDLGEVLRPGDKYFDGLKWHEG
jgi:hypothetical protein